MALQGTAKIKLTVDQKDAIAKLAQFKQKLAGLGKVVTALGGVFGTVGFGAFASKAVFTAARTRELDVIMEQLGKTAGVSADYLHEQEEAVKALGITTQGSRNIIIQMLRSQLDLTKATELANVARNAAVISGENTSDAIEGLITGIVTLQSRMLRNHGVTIQLNKSYKAWADRNNRTVESLSAVEQQMIALNAVIEYGVRIEGAYEAAMEEAGKRWRSLPRYIEEMFNALGEGLFPAFEAMVDWLTTITKGMREWFEQNQALIKARVQDYVNILSTAFGKLAGFVSEYGRELYNIAKVIIATAIIHKLVSIGHAIVQISIALKALGVAGIFAAGPIGLITIALSALVGSLILASDKADENRRAVSALGQEYLTLAGIVDDTIESQEALDKAWAKLQSRLPTRLFAVPEGLEGEVDPKAWRSMVTEALVTNKDMLQMALDLSATEERYWRGVAMLEEAAESGTKVWEGAIANVERNRLRMETLAADLLGFIRQAGTSIEAAKKWGKGIKPELEGLDTTDIVDANAAFAAAMEAVTAFRVKTLGDSYAKQVAAIKAEQVKLISALSKIPGLDPEDLKKIVDEIERITTLRLKGADEKRDADRLKADRKAADKRKEVILKELDFQRSIFAWSLADYIAHLEAKQAEYETWSEDWKVLEEERLTLMRDQAIQDMNNIRASYAAWRDFAVDSLMTVSREWKNMGDAIKRVGLDIVNILVRKALTQLIDKLWAATIAAKALSAALPLGMGGGVPGGGFLGGGEGVIPPYTAAKGLITSRPMLTLAGEHEPELIAPVRSLMNAIAARDQSRPSFVLNMHVNTLDAASFDDYMTDEGGDVLTRLVQRNWLDLGD